MAGHLLSDQGIISLGQSLIEVDDPELYQYLTAVTNTLGTYIEIAKAKGMDASDFLYPAMKSRDFHSVIDAVRQLTPSQIQADENLYRN